MNRSARRVRGRVARPRWNHLRPFTFCVSADAAALLASFDDLGLLSTRDAADAARDDVVSLLPELRDLAMVRTSRVWVVRCCLPMPHRGADCAPLSPARKTVRARRVGG